jgi:molybdenum cofactor cytidylyltransferase
LIAGVILAAGTSSRLGRPKQLLDLGGKPVLQHTIDIAASTGVDEIVLVLGHLGELIRSAIDLPPLARVVSNPDYDSGQASSLRVGLAAVDLNADAAVVFLGDQPVLDPRTVADVVEGWRRSEGPVARAVYRGTPGHPVVIGREAFDSFASATGDDGSRRVLERLDVVEVNIDAPAPFDIDTWEQYEEVRRAF